MCNTVRSRAGRIFTRCNAGPTASKVDGERALLRVLCQCVLGADGPVDRQCCMAGAAGMQEQAG